MNNITVEKLLWMIVFIGAVGLFTYMMLHTAISIQSPTDKLSLLNAIILSATGLVIIWYTVETKYLRKESQWQTEMQQRPFVVFEVDPTYDRSGKDVPSRFLVRNVGAGTAINVRVRQVVVSKTLDASIQFPDVVTVLPAGGSQPIHTKEFFRGKPVHDYHLDTSLDRKYTSPMRTEPLMVTVEFQNVKMMRYFITLKVESNLLEIIEVGRVSRSIQGNVG